MFNVDTDLNFKWVIFLRYKLVRWINANLREFQWYAQKKRIFHKSNWKNVEMVWSFREKRGSKLLNLIRIGFYRLQSYFIYLVMSVYSITKISEHQKPFFSGRRKNIRNSISFFSTSIKSNNITIYHINAECEHCIMWQ